MLWMERCWWDASTKPHSCIVFPVWIWWKNANGKKKRLLTFSRLLDQNKKIFAYSFGINSMMVWKFLPFSLEHLTLSEAIASDEIVLSSGIVLTLKIIISYLSSLEYHSLIDSFKIIRWKKYSEYSLECLVSNFVLFFSDPIFS